MSDIRDEFYRIYKNGPVFLRYEITQGSKAPGQIYRFCGLAATLSGAKRKVARCIREDQEAKPQPEPVWTQTRGDR